MLGRATETLLKGLLSALLLVGSADAAEPPAAEAEKPTTMADMAKKLEQMQQQLDELAAQLKKVKPTDPRVDKLEGAVKALEDQLDESEVDTPDPIQFHGSGMWAYGRTSANHYVFAGPDGEWDHVEFSLLVTAKPMEKLTLAAQVYWGKSHDGPAMELDFAYAEWAFVDAVALRAGKIKQPFGLYTEIFAIGTLRPFLSLAQSIYGPSGFVSKAFNGLEVYGRYAADSGWGLEYEVYGGQVDLLLDKPFNALSPAMPEMDEHDSADATVTDLVGGRVTLLTPLDGFRISAQAYAGTPGKSHIAGEEPDLFSHYVVGASIEYLGYGLSLQAEVLHHAHHRMLEANAAYFEAAYRLTDHWQIAGRFDWFDGKLQGIDDSAAPSLLEHLEGALGVNYWFNSQLVLKFQYSFVSGNRFSHPETEDEIREAIAAGSLKSPIHLGAVGIHFSF